MKHRLIVICIITVSVFLMAFWVHASSAAQNALTGTPATPTPAPSKTATAVPVLATNTTPTQQPKREVTKPPVVTTKDLPFTQEDLSVLTGNIQRPNGLAWHDNKLYVSCSGDWTVYEIDQAS